MSRPVIFFSFTFPAPGSLEGIWRWIASSSPSGVSIISFCYVPMIFHSPIFQRITQSLASAPNIVLVYIRQQKGSLLGFGHSGLRRTKNTSEISVGRVETHQLDLDQTYNVCIGSIYICQIDPKYLLSLLGSILAAHPHACPRSKLPMVRRLQSEDSMRDCIQDSSLCRSSTRQYSDEFEGSPISPRSVYHQGALFLALWSQ